MTRLEELIAAYRNTMPCVKLNRTIFFDESNNFRKGVIGTEKDNNEDLENLYFTLGGIATKDPINFPELLDYIGAKQIPRDAKYKFFTLKHNGFTEAIAQPRLRKLFEYLKEKDIVIHFAVEHYFHFALVDILDSLIEEDDANQYAALCFYKELQSDMTEVLYEDFELLHKILVKYEFPNIPKGKANDFIRAILDLYTTNLDNYNMDDPENFTKELLRQIIKAKRNKGNLVFLEENQPFVISERPYHVYLTRMFNFCDKKIFDRELSIEAEIRKMDDKYETKLNAEFSDSENWREIQISDAISGFVGRLYNFLSKTDHLHIWNFSQALDKESESYKTLRAFFDLMTRSNEVSEVCFMKTNPLFIDKRFDLLCNAIENK